MAMRTGGLRIMVHSRVCWARDSLDHPNSGGRISSDLNLRKFERYLRLELLKLSSESIARCPDVVNVVNIVHVKNAG